MTPHFIDYYEKLPPDIKQRISLQTVLTLGNAMMQGPEWQRKLADALEVAAAEAQKVTRALWSQLVNRLRTEIGIEIV